MASQDTRVVLVLDTNVVLDLLVFGDPAVASLKQALEGDAAHWLTTGAMRAEFERVLAYPDISARLQLLHLNREHVLAHYDRLGRTRAPAPLAAVRCSDRDDQIFIDLAVAHQTVLLSKDRAVLRLRKRLAMLGVEVKAALQEGDLDNSSCSRKLCALESGQDCR